MRQKNIWKTLPTRLELVGLRVQPEGEPNEHPCSVEINLSGFMELEMPGEVIVISVETEDGRILEKRRVPLALFDDAHALRREYPQVDAPKP